AQEHPAVRARVGRAPQALGQAGLVLGLVRGEPLTGFVLRVVADMNMVEPVTVEGGSLSGAISGLQRLRLELAGSKPGPQTSGVLGMGDQEGGTVPQGVEHGFDELGGHCLLFLTIEVLLHSAFRLVVWYSFLATRQVSLFCQGEQEASV